MAHHYEQISTNEEFVAADNISEVQYTSNEEYLSATEQDPEPEPELVNFQRKSSGLHKASWRTLIGYWLLGLTNNFAYVIMLTAAHDILSKDFKTNSTESVMETLSNVTNPRDCNTMGTGTILLADIIPGLMMKIFAPFTCSFVHMRVFLVVILCCLSFLLVGLASSVTVAIIGVVCASASSGLGEVTFLAYSAYFHKNVISAWSSGTGGAGLFGAVSYAGLTAMGLSPQKTVLTMLIAPGLMVLSFYFLLDHPQQDSFQCLSLKPLSDASNTESEVSLLTMPNTLDVLTLKEKISFIPSVLKYMLPLGLVYIAEYVINQGLFELVYFPSESSWLNHHQQYRWYQVIYQMGVLISRSSVNIVQIKNIWSTALLQWGNVIVMLTCAIYWWIGSIWVVMFLILWEGLLGGAAYVNTFYRISTEIPESHKEFAMAITSLADTTGVTIAGFIAIPLHNAICQLPMTKYATD